VTSYLSGKLSKLRSFDINSAGLKTVLYRRLSHRELRSSLMESHSFLSLPADTTMASSQSTQPSEMNKREATLAFIETYNRYLNFGTQKIGIILLWPMWQENSKRQPFFIHHSHTHKKTHRTDKKKLTNLMETLCCAREHSVQFYMQYCTQLNCTV